MLHGILGEKVNSERTSIVYPRLSISHLWFEFSSAFFFRFFGECISRNLHLLKITSRQAATFNFILVYNQNQKSSYVVPALRRRRKKAYTTALADIKKRCIFSLIRHFVLGERVALKMLDRHAHENGGDERNVCMNMQTLFHAEYNALCYALSRLRFPGQKNHQQQQLDVVARQALNDSFPSPNKLRSSKSINRNWFFHSFPALWSK